MTRSSVSIKIRRQLEQKFGMRCGFPGCKKPAVDLHHTKRFLLVKRHRAEEMVPLCKIHHELAHAGLIENEESSAENWVLKLAAEKIGEVAAVDKMVQKRKKFVVKIRDSKEDIKNF